MRPANAPGYSATAAAPAHVDYYKYVEDVLAPEDIHDFNVVNAATATNGLFLVLAVILTLVHAFILYLFLCTQIWPVVPLLLHVAVAVVTALITWAQYRRGMDVQYLAILAIVSFTTGIFGTAGALIGFIG